MTNGNAEYFNRTVADAAKRSSMIPKLWWDWWLL